MAKEGNVPFAKLGVVGGQEIAMPGNVKVALAEAAQTWGDGLKKALGG
jgi:hypothetical protein